MNDTTTLTAADLKFNPEAKDWHGDSIERFNQLHEINQTGILNNLSQFFSSLQEFSVTEPSFLPFDLEITKTRLDIPNNWCGVSTRFTFTLDGREAFYMPVIAWGTPSLKAEVWLDGAWKKFHCRDSSDEKKYASFIKRLTKALIQAQVKFTEKQAAKRKSAEVDEAFRKTERYRLEREGIKMQKAVTRLGQRMDRELKDSTGIDFVWRRSTCYLRCSQDTIQFGDDERAIDRTIDYDFGVDLRDANLNLLEKALPIIKRYETWVRQYFAGFRVNAERLAELPSRADLRKLRS